MRSEDPLVSLYEVTWKRQALIKEMEKLPAASMARKYDSVII